MSHVCKTFIAIDGGGTKTEAVQVDEQGRLLAGHVCGATNPNDVGVETAVDLLARAARSLSSMSGVPLTGCYLFGGIAGALNHKEHMQSLLAAALPEAAGVRIDSDVINLLSSELPMGDGACIICGTGSACFLRRKTQLIRIGGWGYLLDSAGSGYSIGRDAMEAVLRAHDGRGQKTCLEDLLAQQLGGWVWDSLSRIYTEGKPLIASMTPAVFEAASQHDPVSEEILDRNARALAEYAQAAWHWLIGGAGHDRVACVDNTTEMPVILGGGVCQHEGASWLARIACHTPPDVPIRYHLAVTPVIWGAVTEAVRMSGFSSVHLSDMRTLFLKEYQQAAPQNPIST